MILLMVLPLGGRLFAQAPLTSYECELEPMRAHVFSSNAQTFTFGSYATGADISTAWLKSNGGYGELPGAVYGILPVSVSNNIKLPGNGFYFGERQMKYFGLTGGGLVYFGETDELRPTYDPYSVFNTIAGTETMKDIAFIRFYENKVSNPPPTVFHKAGDNTSVQYEIVADTLFIAYNNVKVFDETFSFQYAFTKDGDVSLIPVNIRPQKTCKFAYGLYKGPTSKTGFGGCFLGDLEGELTTHTYPQIAIDNTSYPKKTYRFHGPEPCVAVENPTVEWNYIAGTDYIEFGNSKMTCNGNACLFILSEKSTLTSSELPQDGTIYKTGDKIGSNSNLVFVGNAYPDKLYFSGNRTASNLKPATIYYIHAFPYNTDCSFVRYNTTNILTRPVSTALKPVNSISVDATTIAENGFTLNINKGTAERYILAVSRRQINPLAMLTFPYKEGGYKAGDRVKFHYVSAEFDELYDLEILTAEGSAAQYEVTDAEPNSDYYYYVWSTDAAQQKFSLDRRTCGASTLYRTTAVFVFDSAAPDQGQVKTSVPAGWELPNSNDRGFFVRDQGGDRILNAELFLPEAGKYRREAISPTMQGGKSVAVSVDFYFWYGGGEVSKNKKLRSGDTVYVQYKCVSDNTWTTLKTLTGANTKEGDYTVTTDRFFPKENFNLRFVGISSVELDQNEEWAFVGIRRIEVGSECNAISSTPEVSKIMNDRATLSWYDEDNTPQAASYYLRYRLSENEDWTGRIAKTRQYTFTGLQPNTLHNMEVAAVCAPGDTSDYVSVPAFTTLRGLPYELVSDASSGITFNIGALPASGPASLTAPDAEKAVWAPKEKGTDSYLGLDVNASLNNPLWLNLPVLSTGASRGKAQFSFGLSAWDATTQQQASFGATDTLLVLFSTNNTFDRSNTKLQVDLSQVTPQGKTFNIEFEVEDSYQYWAIYTNLQTAGNVLFIDSLNIRWGEMYCNAVSNIRHSNIGYYSVDISWNGEGEQYGIFYNDRKTDKWDSVFTYETTHTLKGLTSATNYQYYIVAYCDADRIKASERSSERYFQTEKVCEVPTLEVMKGSETWQGVTLITHSNEPNRQFKFEPKGISIDYGLYAGNRKKDTIDIAGLTFFLDTLKGATYYVKVCALCANDTSDWSEPKEFTLKPTPVCHNPTNLKASVNAATQVATLSWTAGTNNEAYAVFVRAGSSRQDTIPTSRTSLNTKVEPDVVYTWTILAACEEPLYSDIVRGPSFSFNSVGVESMQDFDKAVKVRIFENQIIIENNQGLYIKSLQAFSVDGKLLRTYSVNSTQNAYIYHTLPKGAALLRVLGENGKTATYKTIIL